MLSNPIFLTVILATLLILLLVAVVVITMVLSNKKNVQQIMKMAELQRDYEKGVREVQEQVMTEVARELHDNVGSRLTFVKTHLQQLKIVNPSLSESLQPVGEAVINTIEEVRMLGRSLNSDHIEKNGLVYTIEKEIERLRLLNKYQVQWEQDAEPELNRDQKVIVFRMFQEMLNNAIKHADAGTFSIGLHGRNGFKLVVADDGKGFDLGEMLASAKGAGLKNIMKRAELAGLKCRIDTAPKAAGGNGTTFTLEK